MGVGVAVVGVRHRRVFVEDLVDETEEDGDDEGGLEGLAEDDEVDGDGEEGGHGEARRGERRTARFI